MKVLLKLFGCFLVAILSLVLGGIVVQAIGAHAATIPSNASPAAQMLAAFLGYGVLAVGMAPLAAGLTGTTTARAGAVVSFLVLALGVNTMIEAAFFTTL